MFCFRAQNLVVVDFGCGDAKLAQSVPNKVHSYDLVAVNKHVTVADSANVSNSKHFFLHINYSKYIKRF